MNAAQQMVLSRKRCQSSRRAQQSVSAEPLPTDATTAPLAFARSRSPSSPEAHSTFCARFARQTGPCYSPGLIQQNHQPDVPPGFHRRSREYRGAVRRSCCLPWPRTGPVSADRNCSADAGRALHASPSANQTHLRPAKRGADKVPRVPRLSDICCRSCCTATSASWGCGHGHC